MAASENPGGIKGMPWSEEALQAVRDIGSGKLNFVNIALDVSKEAVYLVHATDIHPKDLQAHISKEEPRYSFLRFKHSFEGIDQEPIVFLYTCPEKAKIKERMVYATSRLAMVKWAERVCKITVDKTLEVSDSEVEELSEEVIFDGLHPMN